MSSDDDYRPEEVALEEEEEVQIIDSDSDYCVEEDSDYSAEKKNAKVSKKRAAPAQHTLTATKRPRPNARDGVDDVDVLKRMLAEQAATIDDLQAQLRRSAMPGSAAGASLALSPEKLQASAETLRRTIQKQISAQMVYKPSVKYGSARVCVEMPNVSQALLEAILGAEISRAAAKGPKQVKVTALDDQLQATFGSFWKSLRYGATLNLVEGLTFTLNKATSTLKINGSYKMHK